MKLPKFVAGNSVRRMPVLFSIVLFASAAAHAADANAIAVKPAIGGYSPVSYFTENRPERGSAEFAVEHDGRVYYLTSREQVRVFERNPDRYRPRHQACPYSLAYGMVLPLDPTNFKIVGDSLLLFHRSEEKDARLEWDDSELSEEELLRRADSNLFLLEF
ncbi:MAG: hypothetical protein AAFX58_04950 [Pseudomonadota bacterium]